ncbi:MAG: dephospho-CoA kinase [Clostridia bacterium]|nr:dephospho-CoA kinase [Clostridia bacterium]
MSKKKIAVTGGIGSGKSTVMNYLQTKGFPVFSCDEIYKEIIQSPAYIEEIKKCFPTAITEGKVDRKALSALVFNDERARERLNQIAHPLIMKELIARMNQSESPLVFVEVPLLFEANLENVFDEILVIMRPKENRKEAVALRDGLSFEEIEARMNAQFDYQSAEGQKRLQKSGAIQIINDQTQKELEQELENWLNTQNVKQLT